MAKLYCILLLLLLVYLPDLSYQDTEVELISPRIVGARLDSEKCSENRYCNFTIWTRASEYKLINFDLKSGLKQKIRRVGNNSFTEVPVLSQKEFYIENGTKRSFAEQLEMSKKADKDSLKQSPGMYNNVSSILICQAATLKPVQYSGKRVFDRCIRDSLIYFGPESMYSTTSYATTKFAVSINAAILIDGIEINMLVMFDAVGRVIVHYLHDNTDILKQPEETYVHHLSVIKHPLDDSSGRALASSMPSTLTNNLQSQLAKTHRGTYIEAISPIYPYDKSLEVGDPHPPNDLPQPPGVTWPTKKPGRTTTVKPKSANQGYRSVGYKAPIALLVANGHLRSNDITKQLTSMWRDVDQMKFIPQIKAGDKMKGVSINALHIWSDKTENKTYFHIAYTYLSSGSEDKADSVYVFCTKTEKYEFDKPTNSTLDLESMESICMAERFRVAPNDIVGYDDDDKCQKTIAFFDNIYTIHEVNHAIFSNKQYPRVNWQWLDQALPFYINAAYISAKSIYFFTHSNSLIIADVSMENCQNLKIGKMSEHYSDDFMIHNSYLSMMAGKPNLVDYREWEKGDDTKPPIGSNQTSGSEPPAKEQRSNLWIIVAVVIFAALIIACIIYMCCLRDTSDLSDVQGRSRKSRRIPAITSPIKSIKNALDSRKSLKSPKQPNATSPVTTVRSAAISSPGGASSTAASSDVMPSDASTPKSKASSKVSSPASSTKSPRSKASASPKSPGTKSKKSPSKKSSPKSARKSPAAKSSAPKSLATKSKKSASPRGGKVVKSAKSPKKA